MSVLIDIRLLGRGGTTGIQEYTRELVSHLLRIEANEKFFLFYNGFRKGPLPEAWINHKQVQVIDTRTPNRIFDLTGRLFGYPKIDVRYGVDVLFSPHFTLLNSARAPRVVTFHDLSFLHHPSFFSPRQHFWHWLQHYRNQATRADHLIAVSEFTKRDLIKLLGVPEKKVSVIYSGISDQFRPISKEAGAKWRKERSVPFPYLLFLGTLEPRKNIELLIRSFELLHATPGLQDHRLIIAGRPGWQARRIFEAAQRSRVHDRIIFWGSVKDEERLFLYNEADVFVYPSFFEGFGFPPLEAQACGTPVIATDRTSLPEIIGTSGVLINPWSVHELAEAIRLIVLHPFRKDTFVKSGLENIRRFSWEKTAQETLTLFHNAKKNRRHHSKNTGPRRPTTA